jgi:hypothetical protein
MTLEHRSYSDYTDVHAKACLSKLLEAVDCPTEYKSAMKDLGKLLGAQLLQKVNPQNPVLVASTAEDADFLASGVVDAISHDVQSMVYSAVFWNNHYQLGGAVGSLAPIVHQYLEPGYKTAKTLIVVKSVISGSCVVRTNLLRLIEDVEADNIFIVSPVIHKNSIKNLNKEFPKRISDKFSYFYFAIDSEKDDQTGEVKPGIGGQIYQLLGLGMQPVQTSFIPELVARKFV